MYNQFQNNMTSSQYQGYQRQYQPVGNVQSFYGQNQQQYGAYPSSESYHTANYRGNQMGHDQGLRGDSLSPTQQGGAMGNTDYSSFRYAVRGHDLSGANNIQQQFGFNQGFSQGMTQGYGQARSGASLSGMQGGFGGQSGYGSQMNYGMSSYGQNPSAESYHTANYRGNQLGHDQGLRGDSFSPTQMQGFSGQSYQPNTNYSSLTYGVRGHDYSGQNNVSQQFGFNNAF